MCVYWCCEYSLGPRAAARHKVTTQLREVAGPSYNFVIFFGLQLDHPGLRKHQRLRLIWSSCNIAIQKKWRNPSNLVVTMRCTAARGFDPAGYLEKRILACVWRFKRHSDSDQKIPQPVLESKMHWHIDRLALAIQKLAQQQQEE